jgi:hypothetical protein
VSCQVVLEVFRGQKRLFYLVVEGELADCHQGRSKCGSGGSRKQPSEAFISVDPPEALNGVFIASNKKNTVICGWQVCCNLTQPLTYLLNVS